MLCVVLCVVCCVCVREREIKVSFFRKESLTSKGKLTLSLKKESGGKISAIMITFVLIIEIMITFVLIIAFLSTGMVLINVTGGTNIYGVVNMVHYLTR